MARAKRAEKAPIGERAADGEAAGAAMPDPFEAWRKLYDANQEAWNKAAQEATGTEAFATAQGRMLETFLALQRSARDAMSAQLATMNLPSRDDVARLGELIIGLEEKIDSLDDRLAAMEKAARPTAPRTRPARTAARTRAR